MLPRRHRALSLYFTCTRCSRVRKQGDQVSGEGERLDERYVVMFNSYDDTPSDAVYGDGACTLLEICLASAMEDLNDLSSVAISEGVPDRTRALLGFNNRFLRGKVGSSTSTCTYCIELEFSLFPWRVLLSLSS